MEILDFELKGSLKLFWEHVVTQDLAKMSMLFGTETDIYLYLFLYI